MASEHQLFAIGHPTKEVSGPHTPVQALPSELVYSCFELLDFHDRISVSHVSRAWRAVALSGRSIWKEVKTRETEGACDMLTVLLARSNPLPFSFSVESPFRGDRPHISTEILGIICRNMHRMQVLSIHTPSSDGNVRLFQQPSPLLEQFSIRGSQGSLLLASLWPRLKTLRVSWFLLPAAPQPFATVRALSCLRIRSFADAQIPLFSLFPALETLRVNQIVSSELDCLIDPPASMSDLSLGNLLGSPVDYAPLARILQGLRLKALRLRRAHEAASVVELFADTTQEPWCMIVAGYYSDRVELREEAQHRVWLVSCDTRISFAREPRLAASLDQLGALTCSMELLVQLHNLGGWTRSLPALRALTLRLPRTEDAYAITSPRSATPVYIPLLNSLTLWLADMTAQIKLVLEMRLPALIPAILERGPPVTVDVIDPDDLRLCDLEPLYGVAEGLMIFERRSGRTIVYSPRR